MNAADALLLAFLAAVDVVVIMRLRARRIRVKRADRLMKCLAEAVRREIGDAVRREIMLSLPSARPALKRAS